MNEEEVWSVCVAAIRRETDNPAVLVLPHMTAGDVAGWDSLAHIRIMLTIAAELGVAVDIERTYTIPTIGELVSFFQDKVRCL